ncbi:tetratricopeptide repeat protein [Elongatibacter sediminis]|uniref:Tetratricopeptide repeat protein n=1 Tax=Elongatibacter sediminis TaxID=3119006 RepID=A0AAW9RJK2_9GAMM
MVIRHVNGILGGLIGAGILLFSAQEALAQSGQCGKSREVGAKALDEATYKQLNGVYEDVGEEKFNDAFNELQKMLNRAGRDEYLQAILHQALAQVEWSRENYDPALSHFEKAVELDALPNQAHFALMYQIAQLYFMKERYDDALERLDLWFCTAPEEKITSGAYVLQASIFAAKLDYARALTAIEKAISMDENPKEPWYQLKLAAHYELEQYPQAAQTLEIMITRWPEKKIYWTQLAQTYYKLKQDDKALSVAALAYRKNLMDKQADVMFLSSLYANSDVPYKAAEVLQKGIEDGIVESTERNWTATADNWYAAEELEKALVAYEKAGQAASDGDIDLRRGYILVDLERWDAAREALDNALEKGGLDERKTGEAYLLRGMAQFNLGQLDRASADWGRASRYPRTKDAAQQWINHLREERRRRAS